MKPFTRTSRTILLMGASLAVFSCTSSGSGKKNPQGPSVEGCPTSAEEIGRIDWGLEPEATMSTRTGLLAASQLELLAIVMEEDLGKACKGLAKTLHVNSKKLEADTFEIGASAQHSCSVAGEAVAKLREIAGGELAIKTQIPDCSTPMGVARECLSACGAIIDPSCEGEVSGSCDGTCEGQCTSTEASKCAGSCDGSCSGSCDGMFEGMCGGKCEGTCDEKKTDGDCAGICRGQCKEQARGSCGGTCIGSCDGACSVQAAGQCDGICAGSCTSKLIDPVCTGSLRLPVTASMCQKSCDSLLMAELDCKAPTVTVNVDSPANSDAAELLIEALTKYVPRIIAARSQVLDVGRVGEATSHAEAALAAMDVALAGAEPQIEAKNKTCVEDVKALNVEVNMALPSMSLAGESIRAATGADD